MNLFFIDENSDSVSILNVKNVNKKNETITLEKKYIYVKKCVCGWGKKCLF